MAGSKRTGGPTPPREEQGFASIVPGLEPLLLEELAELGVRGRVEDGGVAFTGDRGALHRIHLLARLPARVLVRVGTGRVTSLAGLAELVKRQPWRAYVWPGQEVEVRVSSRRSRLRHDKTVERKVAHAVRDALRGPRADLRRAPREPARVSVRIVDDVAELSVDASGELLHRRGWRRATAKAPLRENLAAAVLWAAGWTPSEPLVDPMCGAGTFAVEAATVAAGIPPGARRSFAFERWPSHDEASWRALAKRRWPEAGRAPLVAADRAEGAVGATRDNARRAGVLDRVDVVHARVAELEPPERRGLVVVNPPWGARVGRGEVQGVWRELGDALRQRWAGWRLAVLVPDRRLLRHLPEGLERALGFESGGIRIELYVGTVG